MADLIVDKVNKEFPTLSDPLVVLHEASLRLSPGQTAAILGPSGSGKSTLLHILGTLDQPTSGSLQLAEQDPFALDQPSLARFRNENIGFVFQDHHLLPQLDVLENTLIPALANGTPTPDVVDRARDLLERVGLSERLQHRPAELSGGERQRVGVARALLNKPRLLLADEPTGNLDRTTAGKIAELLLKLQQEENAMLVAVTHSRELAELFPERFYIDEGRLRPESE
ncbi:MAG TPA: ATP-binding protein [Planctomycetaceae bacterium]|nr:ATP-binding protein [Blastopirellula sp.]HAY80015.1 ATP-binding protein [Planctomycetaceae bacterium]